MTGIAALIFWSDRKTGLPIERMLDGMSHRGRAQQVLLSPRAALGVAYTPAGQCPTTRLGRPGVSCVADARLDNRRELQAALGYGAGGSLSDAELLVLGYERWATQLAERLVGDFAFIIWDERAGALYAARDAFGTRTLFYREDAAGLFIASEVGPLLSLLGGVSELEDDVVLDYLLNEHCCGRETFFRHVFRIQPGHWLLAEQHSLRQQRYWHPPDRLLRLAGEREYVRRFRGLFRSAVQARIDGDCPTVAQLSGGLDSSSVVAVAEQIHRHEPGRPPLVAASAIYPGLACDESPYLDAIAHAVRFRVVRWNGRTVPLFDPDSPVGPSFPWEEAGDESAEGDQTLARQVGARGILSGFGGDQLLFEHGVYRDLAAEGKWLRLILETTCRSYSSRSRLEALADALRSALPRSWKRWYRSRWPAAEPRAPVWLSAELRERWDRRSRAAAGTPIRWFASHSQQAIWKWLTSPHFWWALETQVLSAARRGLEMRFPFLDRRLADFVLAIPHRFRLPGGRMKRLLRRAMQGVLPAAVLNRRTVTTFESVPQAEFPGIRGRLEEFFSDGGWLSSRYWDPGGVRTLWDAAANDGEWESISNLLDVAQLEVWLRGLHNRGVLQLQGAIH